MATAVIDDAEQDLITRCRRGDQEAFRLLMDRHHQRVYRTAYAVTGSATEAGDITQETFIKAWRGLPRFRHDAALATWLTRVALNSARDHLRRQRAREVLDAARGLIHLQPTRDATTAIEDRDELNQALSRLSPRARQVIALRYGLDLPLSEIAEVLGCPEGTVKSRLNAALGKLRTIIGEGRASSR
jgi:RNA polymerase sigma-70 factor (ECF subfamily)